MTIRTIPALLVLLHISYVAEALAIAHLFVAALEYGAGPHLAAEGAGDGLIHLILDRNFLLFGREPGLYNGLPLAVCLIRGGADAIYVHSLVVDVRVSCLISDHALGFLFIIVGNDVLQGRALPRIPVDDVRPSLHKVPQ